MVSKTRTEIIWYIGIINHNLLARNIQQPRNTQREQQEVRHFEGFVITKISIMIQNDKAKDIHP